MEDGFDAARNAMVTEQLIPRGIRSGAVLEALRNVPRHLFVPDNLKSAAYDDSPLPVGLGQTISQPYIVAYMTEQLEPFLGMKVLEIGTGSGYQAAVLAYLGCDVFTIELHNELAVGAKNVFEKLGYKNIHVRNGDGYIGWVEEAPFDAIIVTAAPVSIPGTLIEQLIDGGKMIIPVGDVYSVQSLKLLSKSSEGFVEKDLLSVRFVPMVSMS